MWSVRILACSLLGCAGPTAVDLEGYYVGEVNFHAGPRPLCVRLVVDRDEGLGSPRISVMQHTVYDPYTHANEPDLLGGTFEHGGAGGFVTNRGGIHVELGPDDDDGATLRFATDDVKFSGHLAAPLLGTSPPTECDPVTDVVSTFTGTYVGAAHRGDPTGTPASFRIERLTDRTVRCMSLSPGEPDYECAFPLILSSSWPGQRRLEYDGFDEESPQRTAMWLSESDGKTIFSIIIDGADSVWFYGDRE